MTDVPLLPNSLSSLFFCLFFSSVGGGVPDKIPLHIPRPLTKIYHIWEQTKTKKCERKSLIHDLGNIHLRFKEAIMYNISLALEKKKSMVTNQNKKFQTVHFLPYGCYMGARNKDRYTFSYGNLKFVWCCRGESTASSCHGDSSCKGIVTAGRCMGIIQLWCEA